MNFSIFFQQLINNLSTLKTTNAWFAVDRTGIYVIDWVFVGLAIFGLLIGITLWLINRRNNNPIKRALVRRWQTLLWWFGVLEILWFGARYEYVSLFGTRFAYAVIFLFFLVWALRLIIYSFRKMKVENREWESKQQKLKYLR